MKSECSKNRKRLDSLGRRDGKSRDYFFFQSNPNILFVVQGTDTKC